jgi:hypothetical protein
MILESNRPATINRSLWYEFNTDVEFCIIFVHIRFTILGYEFVNNFFHLLYQRLV